MFCQRGLWPGQQFSCPQDSAVLGRFKLLVGLLIKFTSTSYCVSGVFLGSASSINITSSWMARPTTLRTALAAMTQVTCLLSLSCTLCQQYPDILSHLVSVHENFFLLFFCTFLKIFVNSMHSKFLSPGCFCLCSFKWPFCEQHS